LENQVDSCFNFIDKCVAETRQLSIVIAARFDELRQCFVNEAALHLRRALRTFWSADLLSTSVDFPVRTAARRIWISSKCTRVTSASASPARLSRSFSTNSARLRVGSANACWATASSVRAMAIEYRR